MRNKINLVKNKRIGRVLFIVEGLDDEMRILHRIFCTIYGYNYEKLDRNGKYAKYTPKDTTNDVNSSIFVINTKESNIKDIEDIKDADGYLNNLFVKLINKYQFPVDKSAIYYIFDRDFDSNKDAKLIEKLIYKLRNSRDGFDDEYDKGLLLLSYPAIESFITANFIEDAWNLQFQNGSDLKRYLHNFQYTSQRINEESLISSVNELLKAFDKLGVSEYDLDDFYKTNKIVYDYEENNYKEKRKYNVISLLSIALLDLGLIEIDNA